MSLTLARAFTVLDAPQRSDAWFLARAGRVTASRASDMLAVGKNGQPLASRANLRAQLVLERLVGKPQESSFQTAAMIQGIEREPLAIDRYEDVTGQLVARTGFLAHAELMAGASLDGHVGDFAGVIEAKCCQPAAHLEVLRSGVVPDAYQKQTLHQMWLTGAAWADVVFFNPDFPERLQLKVIRIASDDAALALYDAAVRGFLLECERDLAALETL